MSAPRQPAWPPSLLQPAGGSPTALFPCRVTRAPPGTRLTVHDRPTAVGPAVSVTSTSPVRCRAQRDVVGLGDHERPRAQAGQSGPNRPCRVTLSHIRVPTLPRAARSRAARASTALGRCPAGPRTPPHHPVPRVVRHHRHPHRGPCSRNPFAASHANHRGASSSVGHDTEAASPPAIRPTPVNAPGLCAASSSAAVATSMPSTRAPRPAHGPPGRPGQSCHVAPCLQHLYYRRQPGAWHREPSGAGEGPGAP